MLDVLGKKAVLNYLPEINQLNLSKCLSLRKIKVFNIIFIN